MPSTRDFDVKPANKMRRQALHIRRKQEKDQSRRKERFTRKKEEKKDPRAREERLRSNIPLTLERKRVWDDVDSDVEDGLGLSVDVERVKRLRAEEEAAEEAQAKLQLETGENDDDDDDDDDEEDDRDSMIDPDSDGDDDEEDDDEKSEEKKQSKRNRNGIRSATERATSPTQSTTSTKLDLAPDALAAKFPTLFSTEPREPKILITTSLNSTLHEQAQYLTALFPNSNYIRRTAHRYAHKYSVREISAFAANRGYTTVLVLEEDMKRPAGLTMVHLPVGPTFHFSISNWIEGKKLPGHGNPTNHIPELILNNFRTPLGLLTAHLFRTLFPPQPEIQGRQVITLHNQRDYIFLRRHRYVFREKRETEKSVTTADGKPMEGVEGIKAGLQELGPRFTLKLRRVDRGIQRASGQEWEWKAGVEKVRTKFQL